MQNKSLFLIVLLGLLWWSVGGCGESGQDGSSGARGKSKAITIDPGGLPTLGGYEPPLVSEAPGLDGNRLKVAFPKGWLIPPRMGQVLVWFKESKQYDYPQILVTAEDFEEVMNVTASTAAEFVRALSTRLRKKIPDLQVASIRVGDRYGALYRRMGRVKSDFTETEVERLVVETVVEGRKYTFELRTYPGHTEKYAPYLYAVFSGTKFLKPEAASEEKPPEKPAPETPPEQPPAKPETPPEKPKTEPPPSAEPPAKPAEQPPEKPKPKETSTPEPKQPPQTKPPEEKPKSEPAEKPKKKKKGDFEIID